MPKAGLEPRRQHLASVIATETYRDGTLWAEPLGARWYARCSRQEPWETGRMAASLRMAILADRVQALRQDPECQGWPELRSLDMHWGQYDLMRRIKLIWRDWPAPEDLPPR